MRLDHANRFKAAGMDKTEQVTKGLTGRQRYAFRRDGFLLIDQVANASEVAALRKILAALFARKAGLRAGHLIDYAAPRLADDLSVAKMPQLRWCVEHAPELATTEFRRRTHAIAKELLGHDAVFAFDHAIIKPAHSGSQTPWHQDMAFQNKRDRHRQITFWMPLQDVALDNSCLFYLPGSHRGPLLHHNHLLEDKDVHGLEARSLPAQTPRAALLQAGGVALHDCRTLHSAGPNLSGTPRWSYAVAYRRPNRDWVSRLRYGPSLRDLLFR